MMENETSVTSTPSSRSGNDASWNREDADVMMAEARTTTTAPTAITTALAIATTTDATTVEQTTAFRAAFYAVYKDKFDKAKAGGSILITRDEYRNAVNMLLNWEQKKEAKQLTIQDRKIFQRYDITIADESSMLRCSGRKVAVFENVFDIIDLAHHQIGHA